MEKKKPNSWFYKGKWYWTEADYEAAKAKDEKPVQKDDDNG